MPTEVITIASLKGGVGKTTTSYALAAAAVSGGLRVVAIDLDPTGGLSNVLEKAKRSVTIADVLQGRVTLEEALVEHPLGIRTVAGHRSLNDEALPAAQLREIFEPVRDSADLILLDTHPHEPSLLGPMAVADRIVIPTALDILSLRAAALTVGLAQQVGTIDKIRGIVVTNAKRPMSRLTESLLNGLTMNGLAFETVLWYSSAWVQATSGRGELPERELLDQTKLLLREVAVRPAPVEALRRFIAMAQGRRGREDTSARVPVLQTAPAFSG
ncbi:MAG TPA: AAA family ATPase [Candidatus Dormibacteraeota bacterium]|nr:AAA family ATPase [Candidatus Dormibacteraeota bacterium]